MCLLILHFVVGLDTLTPLPFLPGIASSMRYIERGLGILSEDYVSAKDKSTWWPIVGPHGLPMLVEAKRNDKKGTLK